MSQQVCMGATMKCSFGTTSAELIVLPKNRVMVNNMPAATVLDNIPLVNILPFGICSSKINPMVAAATSTASGILTPTPCIPQTETPWSPGSATVMLANIPALNSSCYLNCVWGGVITVIDAGQVDCKVN